MSSTHRSGINRREVLLGSAVAALLGVQRPAFADLLKEGASGHVHGGSGCALCSALAGGVDDALVLRGSRPRAARTLLAAAEPGAELRNDRAAAQHADGEVIVIQPSWVLVPAGDKLDVLNDHDVVVKGDRIEEVRPRTAGKDRRIDARGQLLLPGFISGHSHAAVGTVTRGNVEENPRLGPGPRRSFLRVMEHMENLSEAELDDLTAFNLAEMVRSGCTTQVEMSVSLKQMQSYVRVATKYGLRGYPGSMTPGIARLKSIWDAKQREVLENSVAATLQEIEKNLAYAQSINGSAEGRIRPMMAPVHLPVHTHKTLVAIKAAAVTLGNGIHMHLQSGLNPVDNKLVHEYWGKGEAAVLVDEGLTRDVRMFGAHMLALDDIAADMARLKQGDNFTFAHCPSAAGAGALPSSQPYPEALAAGLNTSIGFDTHSGDYVENVKLAVMQGRARAQLLNATSNAKLVEPTIWHGLESGTRGGARGLGRDDLGRIEAGAKADLVTIDLSSLLIGNGTRPREPWNNLMYANGLSVRNVMIDGVWKVFEGKLTFIDEATLTGRGGTVVRKLWSLLEKEDFFVPMRR
jgi:5-methylthioadenosine/S-adenosylhomocysteine deaminase